MTGVVAGGLLFRHARFHSATLRGTKLKKLVLSDELKPTHRKRELPSLSPPLTQGCLPLKGLTSALRQMPLPA